MDVEFMRVEGYTGALPAYSHEHDAGLDLSSAVDCVLNPGQWSAVPTGWRLFIPAGYEGQVRPRSGIALKHGVTVLNAPGTIDAGYTGELKVPLINHGGAPFVIRAGDRIAQLVIAPVTRAQPLEVYEKPDTERGDGGFGSTGRAQKDNDN